MTTTFGRVHFIGIGGAGMSAIAKVLIERGVRSAGQLGQAQQSRVARRPCLP